MNSLTLKSPQFDRESIEVPAAVAQLGKAFNGTICSKAGDDYLITDNIIHLLTEKSEKTTLAQMTNHWKLTAGVYEDVWRVNALSLMSGETYPIDEELKLVMDWLEPEEDKCYLDVGCSTALYGRAIQQKTPGSQVIALDFSVQMLEEARLKAREENRSLFLLKADASNLPLFGRSIDGAVCGGSLNEFYDPIKVLYEMYRVLKPAGTVVMMHLLKADTWYGKLLQEPLKATGLHFWTQEESVEMFERCGFAVEKELKKGIVMFTKLRPR